MPTKKRRPTKSRRKQANPTQRRPTALYDAKGRSPAGFPVVKFSDPSGVIVRVLADALVYPSDDEDDRYPMGRAARNIKRGSWAGVRKVDIHPSDRAAVDFYDDGTAELERE